MQTTKFLTVIGLVSVLVASARTGGARDTEEQIKAREVLRQKMVELNTNTPPATVPKPAASEPPPAPAKPVEPAAPTPPIAPATAVTPEVASPGSSKFGPVPDPVEDAKASKAREALRQEMALLQGTPAVAAKPTKAGHTPTFASAPVMETPPSPLTGPKAARLAELLQRYNADQVTPKEYHTQRAAILAEP